MTLRRILGLVAGRPGWLLLGAAVAAIAVVANVALVATSAYLISRAQTVTNVADLAIAITTVRVLAIGRAVARYIERLVIHAGTFHVLADLRSWFFRSIEPLAPAGLRDRRSGDLLSRITADVTTLEEVFAGVAVPPIAAAAAIAFGCLLLGAIDPLAGAILLAFALGAGLLVPALVRSASRGRSRTRIAPRAPRRPRTRSTPSGGLQTWRRSTASRRTARCSWTAGPRWIARPGSWPRSGRSRSARRRC